MGGKGLGLKARTSLVFLPTLHGVMTLLAAYHRAALHRFGSGKARIGIGGGERHGILLTLTAHACVVPSAEGIFAREDWVTAGDRDAGWVMRDAGCGIRDAGWEMGDGGGAGGRGWKPRPLWGGRGGRGILAAAAVDGVA